MQLEREKEGDKQGGREREANKERWSKRGEGAG